MYTRTLCFTVRRHTECKNNSPLTHGHTHTLARTHLLAALSACIHGLNLVSIHAHDDGALELEGGG